MTRDVKLKFIFKFPFSFPRTRAGYKCTNFVPKTWNKVHSTNLAFRKYFLSVIDLLSLFWVQYSADHTLTISWLTRLSREDILEQKLSRYNAEFAVFLSIFMNIFFLQIIITEQKLSAVSFKCKVLKQVESYWGSLLSMKSSAWFGLSLSHYSNLIIRATGFIETELLTNWDFRIFRFLNIWYRTVAISLSQMEVTRWETKC